MRRSVKLCIAVCALITATILVASPLLINDESLRDTLTEQLSTALGRHVSIEKLTFRLVPHPSVTLQNSSIELDPQPEHHIHIDRMHTSLSIRALLKGDISVTQLEISGLKLSDARIQHIKSMLIGSAAEDSGSLEEFQIPLHLTRARLKDVTWETADGRNIGPFSATFVWKQGVRPESVDILQDDGHVKIRLLPDQDGINFHLHAFDVDLPTDKAFHIDHLDSHGRYSQSLLTIEQADIKALNSRAQVSGAISWSDSLKVNATLIDSRINLPAVLGKTSHTPIPGIIEAKCDVQLAASEVRDLFKNPNLDCLVSYLHSHQPARIELKTLAKNDSQLSYQLTAENLTLPVKPNLHFDKLTASGELSKNKLHIQAADIQAYQGKLVGTGTLSWSKGWRFNFDARSHHLQIEPILSNFNKHSLDGFLDADCTGILRNSNFNSLAQRPTLNCNFVINDGVLYNTDLESAASLVQTAQAASGNTPFDRLSGKLKVADGNTRMDKVAISSNALQASGHVAVDQNDKVTGELSVGLKHTNNIVSIPLIVSGNSDSPTLRPTKSAMAGGAAGTLILGPGIGTAIGVKVGEAVQKFSRWLKPKQDDSKDKVESRK